MKKLILILVAIGCKVSMVHANGGTTIGSGGDALRELFENAKGVAALRVEQLNSCSFNQSIAPSVKDWLLQNQTRLAKDLRLSQHAWVVDTQSTCGFTSHEPQSTIYLSYPVCASTSNNLTKAVFVLLHETSHHLGINDERQADEIARAIMTAKSVPRCSGGEGVFDPNICSSSPMTTADARKYFNPGDTQVSFGIYRFYGQISRCVTLSGCEPAKEANLQIYQASQRVDSVALLLTSSKVDPYFSSQLAINNSVYKLDNTDRISTGVDYQFLTFYTRSYRDDLPIMANTIDTYMNGKLRYGKDCLWSKWSYIFEYAGGVTEKLDVVLYGTH